MAAVSLESIALVGGSVGRAHCFTQVHRRSRTDGGRRIVWNRIATQSHFRRDMPDGDVQDMCNGDVDRLAPTLDVRCKVGGSGQRPAHNREEFRMSVLGRTL